MSLYCQSHAHSAGTHKNCHYRGASCVGSQRGWGVEMGSPFSSISFWSSIELDLGNDLILIEPPTAPLCSYLQQLLPASFTPHCIHRLPKDARGQTRKQAGGTNQQLNNGSMGSNTYTREGSVEPITPGFIIIAPPSCKGCVVKIKRGAAAGGTTFSAAS